MSINRKEQINNSLTMKKIQHIEDVTKGLIIYNISSYQGLLLMLNSLDDYILLSVYPDGINLYHLTDKLQEDLQNARFLIYPNCSEHFDYERLYNYISNGIDIGTEKNIRPKFICLTASRPDHLNDYSFHKRFDMINAKDSFLAIPNENKIKTDNSI